MNNPGRKPLADAERAILIEMLRADLPRLTYGQLQAKFRAATGRYVAKGSIRYIEARGGYGIGAVQLSRPERAILDVLIRDAKPHYCRREIARQFAAMTGRRISPCTVYSRCLKLGLPRYRKGRHAGGLVGGEHHTSRVEVERDLSPGRRMAQQHRGRTSPDRTTVLPEARPWR